MSSDLVLVEKHEKFVVLTLNHPPVNALSYALLHALHEAVKANLADSAVRCVVITGGTGKFFSAGAHLPSARANLTNPEEADGLFEEGLALVSTIENASKPVVAAVNGVCVGGGTEIILACHLRIAAESASFGQPEVNIGISPGWGGTFRLARMIGHGRALDWTLTGRMAPAQEAYQAGLVSRLVPDSALMKEALEVAAVLSDKGPVSIECILQVMRECALDPGRAIEIEAAAFERAIATEDAVEGVTAFLEKRKPQFTGK